jgi:hypothetical protein
MTWGGRVVRPIGAHEKNEMALFALVGCGNATLFEDIMRLSKTVQTYVQQPNPPLLHPYTMTMGRRHKP